MLDIECWMLDFGFWILDFGFQITNPSDLPNHRDMKNLAFVLFFAFASISGQAQNQPPPFHFH